MEIKTSSTISHQFKEKNSYKYIYVDSANKVHIFVPLSRGDEIALDNTCRSGWEMKEFFGCSGAEPAPISALDALNAYMADLKSDLQSLTKNSPYYLPKLSRRRQLKSYKAIILDGLNAQNAPDLHASLTGSMPSYPRPITLALAEDGANCAGMRLTPPVKDNLLRIENPRFSLKREGDGLAKALNNLPIKRRGTLLDIAQERYNAKYSKLPTNHTKLDFLKQCIQDVFKEVGYVGEVNCFVNVHGGFGPLTLQWLCKVLVGDTSIEEMICSMREAFRNAGHDLNSETCRKFFQFYEEGLRKKDANELSLIKWKIEIAEEVITIQDVLNTLKEGSSGVPNSVSYALTELARAESPFNTAELKNVSILIQFFLGVACLYSYEHSDGDGGGYFALEKFDNAGQDRQLFLESVKEAYEKGYSVEECIFDLFKTIYESKYFEDPSIRQAIKQRFREQWACVEGAVHFDEFLQLLPDKQGGHFYGHQNRIGLHLGAYLLHHSNFWYKTYFFSRSKQCFDSGALTKIITTTNDEHPIKLSATNAIVDQVFYEPEPEITSQRIGSNKNWAFGGEQENLEEYDYPMSLKQTQEEYSEPEITGFKRSHPVKKFLNGFFKSSIWGSLTILSLSVGLLMEGLVMALPFSPVFQSFMAAAIVAIPLFGAFWLVSALVLPGRALWQELNWRKLNSYKSSINAEKILLASIIILSASLSIIVPVILSVLGPIDFFIPVVKYISQFLTLGLQGLGFNGLASIIGGDAAALMTGILLVTIPVMILSSTVVDYLVEKCFPWRLGNEDIGPLNLVDSYSDELRREEDRYVPSSFNLPLWCQRSDAGPIFDSGYSDNDGEIHNWPHWLPS